MPGRSKTYGSRGKKLGKLIKDMKAMIFAAGMGTRLKPFTEEHPKALAIVNKKPLLQRNIEYLSSYGIKEFVINIHHFPEQIIKNKLLYRDEF